MLYMKVFGIDTSECILRSNAYSDIMKLMIPEIQQDYEDNREYICEDYPDYSENEMIEVYFNEYYQPQNGVAENSVWGALAESINTKEFNSKLYGGWPFNADGYTLFAWPCIPYDENSLIYTQKQIIEIIGKWITPLLEVPVNICWHTLYSEDIDWQGE